MTMTNNLYMGYGVKMYIVNKIEMRNHIFIREMLMCPNDLHYIPFIILPRNIGVSMKYSSTILKRRVKQKNPCR